jgi:hypothetical protein
MALCNSRTFDFATRIRVGTNLNQFLFESLPVPSFDPLARAFLAHGALRLTCNHAAYAALWHEQVGEAWREASYDRGSLPALSDHASRRQVRADLDAVVAHAYGLDRDLYDRLLSTSANPSDRDPTRACCLEAFDAIVRDGLEGFVARRDPYADLPIATTLPERR